MKNINKDIENKIEAVYNRDGVLLFYKSNGFRNYVTRGYAGTVGPGQSKFFQNAFPQPIKLEIEYWVKWDIDRKIRLNIKSEAFSHDR